MLHVQLSKFHKLQGTTTWTTIHVCLDLKFNLAYFCLLNMAQAIETPQKTPQVGGRGLLMVWRKELEKKLSINR